MRNYRYHLLDTNSFIYSRYEAEHGYSNINAMTEKRQYNTIISKTNLSTWL